MTKSRFTYHRTDAVDGPVSGYEVREDGVVVAYVARTRHGWRSWTADGKLVVEDYRGSREVAASVASREN